jgi:hypothetical protein
VAGSVAARLDGTAQYGGATWTPGPSRRFPTNLLLGCFVVAAGSAVGLWLPLSAALLVLALALCRVCWIEDNIHQDLLRAETVPAGYRECRRRRRGLIGAAFGDLAEEVTCPRRLALELRLQSHAWAAFAWAIAAGAVLPAGVALTFGAGALALLLALRHADYLALGAALLTSGAPLPPHLIAGRGPLSAQLAIIPRRPD